MANPVLPNGMCPIVAAYSNGAPGGVVGTEVAGGVSRYALDWDRGTQPFQVTLLLNAVKYSAFSMWFHHIVKKGSISFEMPLDSGLGVQPHLCNIVPGSYNAAKTGGTLMAVSFVVEAEATAYSYTEVDAQALVDMYNTYGMDVKRFMNRLEKFATVDSNVLDFDL